MLAFPHLAGVFENLPIPARRNAIPSVQNRKRVYIVEQEGQPLQIQRAQIVPGPHLTDKSQIQIVCPLLAFAQERDQVVAHLQVQTTYPIPVTLGQVGGFSKDMAPADRQEPVFLAKKLLLQTARQPARGFPQLTGKLGLFPDHQLSGRRWSGGPQIGDEITNREISFMAHGGNNRNG